MQFSALAFILFIPAVRAAAQEQCVPFGGTIYGWHNGVAWYGVGDFTVGNKTMHATVTDPNTAFTDMGDVWLGKEEATFTFAKGEKITLMTDFVTEHMTDSGGDQAVFHVNETGYFAHGTGHFKGAWGRFNLQGPFGWGVMLPAEIVPGPNDGLFWIGQYNGTICGVRDLDPRKD